MNIRRTIDLVLFLVMIACFMGAGISFAAHRGADMPVNRAGYHMVVVIEDPRSHGKHVSMIDDKTEEECATATIAIQRLVPDALVLRPLKPDQSL
jgi:hypothetical protein